jgi:hypothetical protein
MYNYIHILWTRLLSLYFSKVSLIITQYVLSVLLLPVSAHAALPNDDKNVLQVTRLHYVPI